MSLIRFNHREPSLQRVNTIGRLLTCRCLAPLEGSDLVLEIADIPHVVDLLGISVGSGAGSRKGSLTLANISSESCDDGLDF